MDRGQHVKGEWRRARRTMRGNEAIRRLRMGVGGKTKAYICVEGFVVL